MSSIHDEPIHELEPANLLTPMDMPDNTQESTPERPPGEAVRRDEGEPVRRDEGKVDHIPVIVGEKMNLGADRTAPVPAGSGRKGRRLAWAALTVAGATACFAAGAAVPVLTKHFGGSAQRVATDVKAADAKAPDVKAPKVSAGTNGPAAAGSEAPSTPTSQESPKNASDGSAPSVPCGRQTWPNYGPDCLKASDAGSTGSAASSVRTVAPDRNPDGTTRAAASPSASTAAAAQPPSPPAPAQPAPAAQQNASPAANQGPTPSANQNAAPPANQNPTVGAAAVPPKEALRTPEESQRHRRADMRSWERYKRHHRRSESREASRPLGADREAAREDPASRRGAEMRTVVDANGQVQDEPSSRADRRDSRERRRSSSRRNRGDEATRREQVGDSTDAPRARGDEEVPAGRPAPRDRGFFLFRPFEREW
jgi:hypothetical protein